MLALSGVLAIAAAQSIVGGNTASIAELRAAAGRGNQAAALELGKRYEAGQSGAPRDRWAAVRWYKRAARDRRVRQLIYSAPVGSERYGRAIDVGSGEIIPGLSEAKERLARLQSMGEIKSRKSD